MASTPSQERAAPLGAISRRGFSYGAAAAVAAMLAGCSTADPAFPEGPDSRSGWGGQLLKPAIEMPDVTLRDTSGNPFSLRTETNGALAILAFGYTNCPDVCPIYLNTLARAIENTDLTVAQAPMVLFVGVDPSRDTPEVLRDYLDRINGAFVGLTGTDYELAQANREAMHPPVQAEPPDGNGEYLVLHSGRLLAYTPDGLAHRSYLPTTRQQDWVADLPRLATGQYQ